jgi:hypothetical protein
MGRMPAMVAVFWHLAQHNGLPMGNFGVPNCEEEIRSKEEVR